MEKLPNYLRFLGLEPRENAPTYYCTPKEANIIGWAGVDGIHYCTIPQFGEMIFAVSPMNFGSCVHPIAHNFEDLLRLLLCCADMAALEQCYAWDEAQFKAFLQANPPTQAQRAALDALQADFPLQPIADAFAYVKQLQATFDLSKIPYTEDYYDPDMNPAAPEQPESWAVYFDKGFWGKGCEPAEKTVLVNSRFTWGQEAWFVPAVYVCKKGLVVDFCVAVDPKQEAAFLEAWATVTEDQLTPALQARLEQENPLHVAFRPVITVNGAPLAAKSGCSTVWLPADFASDAPRNDLAARQLLTHYGLTEASAWSFHRWAFPWVAAKPSALPSLRLKLTRAQAQLPGPHFRVSGAGETFRFTPPRSARTHTLTVLEYEQQTLPAEAFPDPGYDYPNQLVSMTYTLEPDLPTESFRIRDCLESETPRRKPEHAHEPQAAHAACEFGVIGGADGPTAILLSDRSSKPAVASHVAVSSLYFQAPPVIDWQMIFREKPLPDLEVILFDEPQSSQG